MPKCNTALDFFRLYHAEQEASHLTWTHASWIWLGLLLAVIKQGFHSIHLVFTMWKEEEGNAEALVVASMQSTVDISNQGNMNNKDNPCHEYNGVLHIAQGDTEGTVSTIFPFFVLNQLIYAIFWSLLLVWFFDFG